MNIKIDLKKHVTNYDDVEIKDPEGKPITYGKYVADALIFARSDNPIRLNDIAEQLHKTGVTELSQADAELVKSLVLQAQNINNMIKAPILKTINAALLEAEGK